MPSSSAAVARRGRHALEISADGAGDIAQAERLLLLCEFNAATREASLVLASCLNGRGTLAKVLRGEKAVEGPWGDDSSVHLLLRQACPIAGCPCVRAAAVMLQSAFESGDPQQQLSLLAAFSVAHGGLPFPVTILWLQLLLALNRVADASHHTRALLVEAESQGSAGAASSLAPQRAMLLELLIFHILLPSGELEQAQALVRGTGLWLPEAKRDGWLHVLQAAEHAAAQSSDASRAVDVASPLSDGSRSPSDGEFALSAGHGAASAGGTGGGRAAGRKGGGLLARAAAVWRRAWVMLRPHLPKGAIARQRAIGIALLVIIFTALLRMRQPLVDKLRGGARYALSLLRMAIGD
eukprot:PLAT1851.2.p1 GENE.PLAT1851.2~~PLAT1851.2.p1  ORF type:complete len:353 (-),score=136.73 PLAT1851.2:161-1219(-)